jgi:hypothetical protein
VSEGTARNKVSLPGGVTATQPRQLPALPSTSSAIKTAPTTAGFIAKADEDKTTAYRVPEELLRRARTGLVPNRTEDDASPDSGAITAPPPAQAPNLVDRVAPRAPGVPQDLLMSLLRSEYSEDEEVTILRPSTTQAYEDAEKDSRSPWGGEQESEFPLVSRTKAAAIRTSAAANDVTDRVVRERARGLKPRVSPVVGSLVFASLLVVAAFVGWFLR